jgi:hypothetical protein
VNTSHGPHHAKRNSQVHPRVTDTIAIQAHLRRPFVGISSSLGKSRSDSFRLLWNMETDVLKFGYVSKNAIDVNH